MPSATRRFLPPLRGRGGFLALLLGILLPTLPALAQQPEAATGRAAKPLATAKAYMVAAANPHAVEAGREILAAGGSAVDAAVAVQLMLGLVEPQSSGIGGGAFLVLSSKDGQVVSYDGRETAPAAATPTQFLGPEGKPRGFREAVLDGRSVGVPGVMRMLELAHRRHGKLAWARLFDPAIRLAEAGFPMSPRLHALLTREKDLARDASARAYFYAADGGPKPVGTPMANPDYAETLRLLARDGAAALHNGAIAQDIVAAVGRAGGAMTEADLAAYQAKPRDPVCGPYRVYLICGMAPPSSGGLTVLQILTLLEGETLAALTPNSAAAVHLIGEAMALAYADRNLYIADPDAVPVPTRGLMDRAYLRDRAALIHSERASGRVAAGVPPQRHGSWSDGVSPELPGTSHVSIVDAEGNALAMTTTIEDGFGARIMVRGFLLNNQLTDFSFLAEQDGKPVANRVEAGKRPRSSMAPTIVLADGKPMLTLGSPGGSSIINYVAVSLIGILDWGLDVQQALDLPHFGNRNTGAIELERGTALETLKPALEALGHKVNLLDLTSGLHGIRIFADRLEGGADPRREGVARGD